MGDWEPITALGRWNVVVVKVKGEEHLLPSAIHSEDCYVLESGFRMPIRKETKKHIEYVSISAYFH